MTSMAFRIPKTVVRCPSGIPSHVITIDGVGVDAPHLLDLGVSLWDVGLVYANGIDPDVSAVFVRVDTPSLQPLKEIVGYWKGIAIQCDVSNGCGVAPAV